jgi:hypothetical protein
MVRVDRLTLTYEGADRFFEIATPSLGEGKRGPRVVIVPLQSEIVAAQSMRVVSREPANALRAEVEQRGRRLGALEADPRLHGQPYGPARLGEPVTIRALNRSRKPVRPALLLEWG